MEALDSALFRIPELVDCRISFGGGLSIEALVTAAGQTRHLRKAAEKLYPRLPVSVRETECAMEDVPLYQAKRYIIGAK